MIVVDGIKVVDKAAEQQRVENLTFSLICVIIIIDQGREYYLINEDRDQGSSIDRQIALVLSSHIIDNNAAAR